MIFTCAAAINGIGQPWPWGSRSVPVNISWEVLPPDPLLTLVLVPSPAPPPHHPEDPVIHVREGALARRITVVHRPALDLLIQALDQFSGRQAARAVDRLLDLGQERLDARRRRLDQDLAAAVAPDVLSQEIEAFLHMRDPGLLV